METARILFLSLMLTMSAAEAVAGALIAGLQAFSGRPAVERPIPPDLLASSAPR